MVAFELLLLRLESLLVLLKLLETFLLFVKMLRLNGPYFLTPCFALLSSRQLLLLLGNDIVGTGQ